jgi:hypothetical protein
VEQHDRGVEPVHGHGREKERRTVSEGREREERGNTGEEEARRAKPTEGEDTGSAAVETAVEEEEATGGALPDDKSEGGKSR